MNYRIVLIFLLFIFVASCGLKHEPSNSLSGNDNDVVSQYIEDMSVITNLDSLVYISKINLNYISPEASDSLIATYYYRTGILFYKLSGFENALNYFILAEKYFNDANLKLRATQMLANQAVLQELKGNYKEAIKIYTSSADVFKQYNDSASWASALGNIGVVYEEMGIAEKAIHYDKLALRIKLARHDIIGAATNYNNIGVIFSELSNIPDSAIFYYNKAFEIYSSRGEDLHTAQALNNLAMIYIMLNKFDLVNNYLEKANHIFDSIGNMQGKAVTQRYYGELYFAKGFDQKSLEHFKNAMNIFKQIDDKKSLMEMGGLISKVYISMGRYPEATKMMQYTNALKDSLMNTENNAIIVDVESKYQLNEKNSTIEVLKLEDELQKKQIKNQTMFIALLFVIFVSIVVIYLFNKNKNKLEQKQLRIELQNYLLRINELQEEIKESGDCSKFSMEKLKAFDLSDREIEVLKFIAQGYKNTEIAEKLFVSQNTIKTHIKNIYVKLDVKNRVEALKRVDIV